MYNHRFMCLVASYLALLAAAAPHAPNLATTGLTEGDAKVVGFSKLVPINPEQRDLERSETSGHADPEHNTLYRRLVGELALPRSVSGGLPELGLHRSDSVTPNDQHEITSAGFEKRGRQRKKTKAPKSKVARKKAKKPGKGSRKSKKPVTKKPGKGGRKSKKPVTKKPGKGGRKSKKPVTKKPGKGDRKTNSANSCKAGKKGQKGKRADDGCELPQTPSYEAMLKAAQKNGFHSLEQGKQYAAVQGGKIEHHKLIVFNVVERVPESFTDIHLDIDAKAIDLQKVPTNAVSEYFGASTHLRKTPEGEYYKCYADRPYNFKGEVLPEYEYFGTIASIGENLIQMGRSKNGKRGPKYNVIMNNCQHFASDLAKKIQTPGNSAGHPTRPDSSYGDGDGHESEDEPQRGPLRVVNAR